MEEEITQSQNQIRTPAYVPTQTMLGLIKSNSRNYDNNSINCTSQNTNTNTNTMHQNLFQLENRKFNEDLQSFQQNKRITFSSNSASSGFNQQTDISEQFINPSTFQNQFLQSPCNCQIQKQQQQQQIEFSYMNQREPQEEMERETNNYLSNSCQNALQVYNNQLQFVQGSMQIQQGQAILSQNKNESNCFLQRNNQQMNEESISAQQPYITKQKKQIQPCCINSNNNNCKYTQFLLSNDHQAKLEALKYFETSLRDCSTTDLLRLFNHKFIDILVENCNNYQKDQKLASMSMKIIFMICLNKCQQLTSRKVDQQVKLLKFLA
ncbi:hypothetical protein TTHERM_00030570 (macronuclear) [Tetrahymena thermophila SB210]|uniref:Uncharacterized protein n=1 Tax=Tetrahymena thermophila (strain SB210) TaxID=312017 RepID=Q22MR6_TETTS|nr:hypothetical protein TTHERM_00030570 [Tetrahymena thermophila SB210]EAR86615.2 hypothetical protein TTHERM_00030570 [Tetrahymena thermophila SB210]|eukprot:XP_976954.2 hypothetical protein TTHERM_00030570 [Tetrahymena thermophila SB210]